jgi:hypothetical protein
MMRLGAVSLAALLAICLAGCQTLNEVTSAISGPSNGSVQPTEPAPETVAPTSPAVANARAASATGLAGMTADGLRAAWGEPTLKRSETGAELWQYGSSNCTLLIYFYPGAGNAMTVSRAEAVPGGADDAAVTACARAVGKPSLKPVS